jgi:hypothetical protein
MFNSEPNKKLRLTPSLASRLAGIELVGVYQKLALLAQDKGARWPSTAWPSTLRADLGREKGDANIISWNIFHLKYDII